MNETQPEVRRRARSPRENPNESADIAPPHRDAPEKIELRAYRARPRPARALPPGGPVIGDYRFEGEDGPTDFAGLFGDKRTIGL